MLLAVQNTPEWQRFCEVVLEAPDALEQRLRLAGVAHARMNDVEQLAHHPVLTGRDRWRRVRTPGGDADAMAPPVALGGVEPLMGDVPALGAHSRTIPRELGCSPEAIDGIFGAGVTSG
ncbi:hypothetical protein MDUV_30390 [Mycolicibacterium duvalii]|uniref:CoA transferase n=1 Tax=Mycolicibacterium duvalii TaxID=39688 RepID=A0A7I7K3Y9_9MYCO|nr:hypothetical protein [Mycolicibacterium duvalii]BBX18179.1 hypothetical protein MDUV_30390 [Mycolicibacterium duvalii]